MTVVAQAKDSTIAEMKALVQSGDINLGDYRGYYRKAVGKDTTLTDAQLVEMVARSDDELDPDDWVAFMKALEEGKPFTLD